MILSILIKLISLIVGVVLLYSQTKELIISKQDIEKSLLFISVVILGSKFVSIIEYYAINNSIEFSFTKGSRLSGAYLFAYLFYVTLVKDKSIRVWFNLFLINVITIIVIGKWSCFFLGDECYGVPTQSIFGMIIKGINPSIEKVHPVPIYDSIYGIFLFSVCNFYLKRKIKSNWLLFECSFFLLILYLLAIESIRINPKVYFEFSINQILYSLLILLIFLRIYYFKKIRKKLY